MLKFIASSLIIIAFLTTGLVMYFGANEMVNHLNSQAELPEPNIKGALAMSHEDLAKSFNAVTHYANSIITASNVTSFKLFKLLCAMSVGLLLVSIAFAVHMWKSSNKNKQARHSKAALN